MRFAPHTDVDIRDMLSTCGLDSLDELFDQIPASVRLNRPLDLPDRVSQMEILPDLRALVEAVHLALTATRRNRLLVSGAIDPRYVEVLTTYGRGAGYEPEVFPAQEGRGGRPDVGDDVAAVVVQHPNHYGILEPARELF